MTIIPFAAALKLLDRAYDIQVFDEPCSTTSSTVNTAIDDDTPRFLELRAEDTDGRQFDWNFRECDNAEVTVEGDLMTLMAEGDDFNEPGALRVRLMAPMVLETPLDEVHKHQCQLESSLNRIIEACGDSSNLPVIRDHARAAKESFNWLDNFAVLKLPPARETPPVILKALRHVRAHVPDVDRVVFWGEGVWVFLTDCLTVPSFDGVLLDISLLEDAANEVGDGYPHAFQLPPEKE